MNIKLISREGRTFWVVYAGLLLLAIGMGLRTGRTMAAVQAVRKQSSAIPVSSADSKAGELARIARKDSLLETARMADRDPFREPPVQKAPRRQSPAPVVAPRIPDVPVIRALLYDNIKPIAQISIGNSVSDWLQQGDVFQGWTVVEISENSVKVSKGVRNFVLRSR